MSLLGFGTVGQALARRLVEAPELARQVSVVSITDRSGTRHDPKGLDLPHLLERKARHGDIGGDARLTPERVVSEIEADVVVDLLPTDLRTAEPSRTLALSALARGRHLVAAGKGVLALHGAQAREAARATGASFRHSAAVCGSTPVLELLATAFKGDRIERFDAVLNGSTNYVLSRLEEGVPFDAAVAQARAAGILEADPSLDLLGLDAAAKAVILANAAWNLDLTLHDVKTQGIYGVTAQEAQEARAKGMAIRLVARASQAGGVAVAPVTLPRDHPLVAEGTENTFRVKLQNAGTITLRGPGAGGRETAAAVLSDILSLPTPPRRGVEAVAKG